MGNSGSTERQQTGLGEETEGVQEERERVARDVGEVFTEAASQEPKAETVLTKKEQSMCNGVVT